MRRLTAAALVVACSALLEATAVVAIRNDT